MSKITKRVICFIVLGVLASIFEPTHSWGQDRLTPTVRAKWLDSSQLVFPLSTVISSSNLLNNTNQPSNIFSSPLTFWLYYGDYNSMGLPAGESQRIELQVKEYNYGKVVLDTSPIRDQIPWLIKQSLSVVAIDAGGQVVDMTYLQMGDLLDTMFVYEGDDLGMIFHGGQPHFRLWAPTAQSVRLHIYGGSHDSPLSSQQSVEMQPAKNGTWTAEGKRSWYGKYYLYEVRVFVPSTGKVESNFVTDPYSVSLAVESKKSHIINPDDPRLKPEGWDHMDKPELVAPEDIVIYESHLRDITVGDPTVPEAYKGTYKATTLQSTNFRRHLERLSDAGLTHIHLLPIFDFASVPEHPAKVIDPVIPEGAGPDSSEQQEAIGLVRRKDSYNWGYDPYHYFVPDGAYSTEPDGAHRIFEVRDMVKSFNDIGLRVVMDVVFNHTLAAGQDPQSVLDKVVPGYYYRLDYLGRVHNSSCCSDTASERIMMEKLIVDAVKFWAKTYKIDGFRFDLMNLHTVTNMKRIRAALDELTLVKDGVDGESIYIYGEGWRFGSLESVRPGESFHQLNAYGQGIGTFNDRFRDAIRGGTTSPKEKSDQGFATGLFYDFNKEPANRNTPIDRYHQREKLLHLGDVIRVGLAGNLRDYNLKDFRGHWKRGGDIYFRGSQTGYSADPQETINYVSAHDGYTVWDAITAKAPFYTPDRIPATATVEEKVRMQNLHLALTALSQGVPFFTAGTDMLRSKSGDTDSYDSGDWFNKIDFSYESNNWGIGLPVAWKNRSDWGFWQPRLVAPDMAPRSKDITFAASYFESLLRVRKSSPLFRLRTREEITERVNFLNADLGTLQTPGLIVMQINDQGFDEVIDPERARIVVLFNANRSQVTFSHPSLRHLPLRLHPELNSQVDPRIGQSHLETSTGTVHIPGRTTLVYYLPRENR